MMIIIIITLVSLGFLSYFAVGSFISYAISKNLLDHPNSRSSHVTPTPRGAGVMFPVLWSIFLILSYFFNFIKISYLSIFLPSMVLIAMVGFFDDKYNLGISWRFLSHLCACAYVLVMLRGFPSIDVGITTIYWGWFGYPFMLVALLWSINLYNFMDGIDGIAAIEAIFVLGFGGYFIWSKGGKELAVIIWAMASIVAGFLVWNKPPAKIFMGDVGSTFLGFLIVLFAMLGERNYSVPFLVWIILYGVFWFDASLTLLRRVIHGDKWYQAHRLHAYQRLQLQKWSHKKILLGVSLTNSCLAGFAFLAFYFPQVMLFSLGASFIMLLFIYLLVERVQPMYRNSI